MKMPGFSFIKSDKWNPEDGNCAKNQYKEPNFILKKRGVR